MLALPLPGQLGCLLGLRAWYGFLRGSQAYFICFFFCCVRYPLKIHYRLKGSGIHFLEELYAIFFFILKMTFTEKIKDIHCQLH